MIYRGNILKMRADLSDTVKYFLQTGDVEIEMNRLIGKNIRIDYLNRINCISCAAQTKTSFHQGYCYSCFTTLPQCDAGVLFPEKDMSHLGISRDMEWAKENSLIDHFVYLAYTGDIKVGVTRHTQIPTRWIDQGAIAAIKFAKTPYRHLAGVIETELKKYVTDKTNWSKMLKANDIQCNLIEEKVRLSALLPPELKKYLSHDNSVTRIIFPHENIQQDYKTVNLDKSNNITGILKGIKGQYLIFEDGRVLNIRKHNGYFIEFEIIE